MNHDNIQNNKDEILKPETKSSKVKKCCFCQMQIDEKAIVCNHCSRNQNKFLAYFEHFGIIISILLVMLAFMQFIEARSERISAGQAFVEAKTAKKQATEAAEKAVRAEQNIIELNNELKRYILSVVSVTYMQLKSRVVYTPWSVKVSDEIYSDIDALLPYLIPDKNGRNKWKSDMENRIAK